MLILSILPVYSKLAMTSELPVALQAKLGDWQLSSHQLQTYQAYQSGGYDVIFNTAMTGDGKSLAAYLPALQAQAQVLAMYPTNELLRDQVGGIQTYAAHWQRRIPTFAMDSAALTVRMQETETASRVAQISKLLEQYPVVLSNPDLFHLMMNFKLGRVYQARYDWERKELPFAVPANFDYFIFDEFHIFNAPQVLSITNILLYLQVQYQAKPQDCKPFVFLSATPSTQMQHFLDRNKTLRVAPPVVGCYSTQAQSGYRPILQPCRLAFAAVSKKSTVEIWVQENFATLLAFYREYPESKGAIIVNSVAAAKRLLGWLKANLPTHIDVGENTGFTNATERAASRAKKLLIGTSTVDVGVDFRINLLIFEASNAGTFIQRFGRLGRHAGFGAYQAYALVPQFIIERIEQALPSTTELDRSEFLEVIRRAYPAEQQFSQYAGRWGYWQSLHLLAQSEHHFGKDHTFVADLALKFDQVFQSKRPFRTLLPTFWSKQKQPDFQPILAELTSFRGQSPLTCGIWDMTDDSLKTYDLLFLVANTRFELMTETEFFAQVAARNLPNYEFQYCFLYLKIYEFVAERQQFYFKSTQSLNDAGHLHQAQALSGLEIEGIGMRDLNKINRALRRQTSVATITKDDPERLKRMLLLPPTFQLYPLRDCYDTPLLMAFGQSALLLDSLLFYRNPQADQAIIC